MAHGAFNIRFPLFILCIVMAFLALSAGESRAVTGASRAVTVQEVAHDLKCPCGCPLVLEDCNMSCGLDWKEQIGEQIKAGRTKDEILQSFFAKYGNACRITPMKRVRSKVFQYTRGFDTKAWVVLGSGAAFWFFSFFLGVLLITGKFSSKKKRINEEKK